MRLAVLHFFPSLTTEVVKRERVESSKGEETLSELSGGSAPTNDLMAKYNNVQDVLDRYQIKPKFGSK